MKVLRNYLSYVEMGPKMRAMMVQPIPNMDAMGGAVMTVVCMEHAHYGGGHMEVGGSTFPRSNAHA